MRRLFLRLLPVLCAVLAMTGTAYAANGYEIADVELNRAAGAVTVRLTAAGDCHLFAALYDRTGRMKAADSVEMTDASLEQVIPFHFDAIGAEDTVSVFLTDGDNAPLCGRVRAHEDGVFAVLYGDGTMVIQNGDTPESGKSVLGTYPVSLTGYDYILDGENQIVGFTTPWYDVRETIEKVVVADKIQPYSTTCWFADCVNAAEFDLAGLDTSLVTDMSYMFWGCSGMTSLDVTGFDTGNVAYMEGMFSDCSGLTRLDVSGFDTGRVTIMRNLFNGCSSLNALDVSRFNTSQVTDMSYLFCRCSALTSLNVSRFRTSRVTDMSFMFAECPDLEDLDVSGFDTSRVTSMIGMFFECASLSELDVSGFDTSQVTDMSYLFWDCASLTELDVSGFDTGRVETMEGMFGFYEWDGRLRELDVSGFDTSQVMNLSAMFQYCVNLTELDLSGFDTGAVTDFSYMFSGCENLVTIYVSDSFVVDSGSLDECMFDEAWSLIGQGGTAYSENYSDAIYARVDNPPYRPGYFTYKAA